MKKISFFTAIIILFVLLTSCSSYAPNEVLYVYNWGEYIDSTVNEKFEQEFGIKVIYDEYDNNESMYATLKNGAAKYDVIFPSDYMIGRLISEDMIEPLNFDNIPNYEHIMQRFKGLEYDPQEKYSVPYLWGSICLLYNSKYVDEAPTSWDVLWDEKYNGKTLMYNNSRDAIGLSLIRDKKSVNSENVDELTAAANNIIELKKNLQAFVSDEIFNRMESESAYITPAYAGDALSMIEENPNLSIATPEEGTNMYIDAMCIVKNSKNKEAAEKYINFMCREDIAMLNCIETWYSTPHQQVFDNLDEEIKNDGISYPSEDYLDKTQVYTNLSPKTLELYTDLWIKIKNS